MSEEMTQTFKHKQNDLFLKKMKFYSLFEVKQSMLRFKCKNVENLYVVEMRIRDKRIQNFLVGFRVCVSGSTRGPPREGCSVGRRGWESWGLGERAAVMWRGSRWPPPEAEPAEGPIAINFSTRKKKWKTNFSQIMDTAFWLSEEFGLWYLHIKQMLGLSKSSGIGQIFGMIIIVYWSVFRPLPRSWVDRLFRGGA